MTTDFPNQEEYVGEQSFVATAITLDSLPSLGTDFTGCAATYSAATLGNLFQSGQLLETRITSEIEDDEARSSLAKVHGKEYKRSCPFCHEARICFAPTTPGGISGISLYRQVLMNGALSVSGQSIALASPSLCWHDSDSRGWVILPMRFAILSVGIPLSGTQVFLLFDSSIPQKPELQPWIASVTQSKFQENQGLATAPKDRLTLPPHLKTF
jgi:hypothetical protein